MLECTYLTSCVILYFVVDMVDLVILVFNIQILVLWECVIVHFVPVNWSALKFVWLPPPAYIYIYTLDIYTIDESSLVKIMVCCLFGTKPLSNQMMNLYQLNHLKYISVKFSSRFQTFSLKEINSKLPSAECQPFCSGFIVLTLKQLGYLFKTKFIFLFFFLKM